jgi:hypothetical protein
MIRSWLEAITFKLSRNKYALVLSIGAYLFSSVLTSSSCPPNPPAGGEGGLK